MGIFEILSFGVLKRNNKSTFMVSDARLRSNRVVNQSTISEKILVGELRQLQLVGKRKLGKKEKLLPEREKGNLGKKEKLLISA